jgi:hypothetical protein
VILIKDKMNERESTKAEFGPINETTLRVLAGQTKKYYDLYSIGGGQDENTSEQLKQAFTNEEDRQTIKDFIDEHPEDGRKLVMGFIADNMNNKEALEANLEAVNIVVDFFEDISKSERWSYLRMFLNGVDDSNKTMSRISARFLHSFADRFNHDEKFAKKVFGHISETIDSVPVYKNDEDKSDTLQLFMEEIKPRLKKIAESIIYQQDHQELIRLFESLSILSESCDWVFDYLEEVYQHKLEQYGLAGKNIIKKWHEISGRDTETKAPNIGYFSRNFLFAGVLEDKEPGICKELYDQFGIIAYGRYHVSFLLDQYEHRDDYRSPYGVIIYPRADHNGAFFSTSKGIDQLNNDLTKKGYRLRVYETGSKPDLYRTLVKAVRRYGRNGHNPIQFVIIGSHGSFTGHLINLGVKGISSDLHSIDIQTIKSSQKYKKVIERLKQVLADDAQIVLNFCYSISDEDNIVRRISELFNTTVIGPTVATGIGDIRVKFNRQDKPKIIVDYAEGDHVRRYFRANKEEK